MKIKPGYDCRYLDVVKNEIDDCSAVMVDANNAYTLDDIELLKRLDAYHLLMIEQPLAWDDIYNHHMVQRELSTPICLDESITKDALNCMDQMFYYAEK